MKPILVLLGGNLDNFDDPDRQEDWSVPNQGLEQLW